MALVRSAEKHSYESYVMAFVAGIYFVWLLVKLSRRFRADEVTLPSK
jgi:hypothetical protein